VEHQDMSEMSMSDAAQASAPHFVTYAPCAPVGIPDQQYWADQLVWEAYKTSLASVAREERKRCSDILKAYMVIAPANVRD
jgi:hypothetical protein